MHPVVIESARKEAAIGPELISGCGRVNRALRRAEVDHTFGPRLVRLECDIEPEAFGLDRAR